MAKKERPLPFGPMITDLEKQKKPLGKVMKGAKKVSKRMDRKK